MTEKQEQTAEWVRITGVCPPEYHHRHVCSFCGGLAPTYVKGLREVELFSRFCPVCGAYMTNNGMPIGFSVKEEFE